MKTRLASVLLLLLTLPAVGQTRTENPPSVEVFELFLEPKPFDRKIVRITGCAFFNAKQNTTNCGVMSPKTGRQVGNLLVDMRTASSDLKRRLLTDCAGDDVGEECDFDVVGRVSAKSFGVMVERARLPN